MQFQLSSYILHYVPTKSLNPGELLNRIPGVLFEPASNKAMGVLIVEGESQDLNDETVKKIQEYPWVTAVFLVHAQHEGEPAKRSDI